MVMKKRSFIPVILVIYLFLAIMTAPVDGYDDSYISFLMRSEMRNEWQGELLKRVRPTDESEKWALLWGPGTATERVSYALSLLQNDQGGYFYEDLSRVRGFMPMGNRGELPGLPRQMIIVQASLASLSLLCEIKSPESLGLARDIVQGLWQNPEFQVVLDRVGKEKGSVLYGAFSTSRGIFSVFQGEFT